MRVIKLFVKYLLRLGPFNFFDYLFQRFALKRALILVRVPGLKTKVAIRNNSSDIPLFAHMFILEEYNVPITGEVETIIDCGANVGLASLYFLLKFPNAKILAIEPEINNFRLLRRNSESYKNITCINKGIWNRKSNLEIIDPGWGSHSFIVRELDYPSANSIMAVSIGDLIQDFKLTRIDILKIDIEGSEEQVFLDAQDWLKKVRIIFCEIHENLKPGLTQKIKTVLLPGFDFFVKGEYHVFESR